jgi:hypothetical protein
MELLKKCEGLGRQAVSLNKTCADLGQAASLGNHAAMIG